MQLPILLNAGSFAPLAGILLMAIIATWIGMAIYSRPLYGVPIAAPVFLVIVSNIALLVTRIVVDKNLIADEITWHSQGQLIAETIYGRAVLPANFLADGKEGYPWLLGFMYAVVGPVPLMPIMLNIILMALLVPVLAVTAEIVAESLRLTDKQGERTVKFTLYYFALVPVITFWAPRLLREIISIFLISVAVLCLLLLFRDGKKRYFLGATIATLLMVAVRAQVGAGLAAGLLMAIVVVISLKFRGLIERVIFIVPFFAVLFTATWRFADSTANLGVENTLYRNNALGVANSAFAGSENLQTADSIVDVIVFNLPRILMGPFPHEINLSSVMLLAAFSNVFWLIGLFMAVRIPVKYSFQGNIIPKNGTKSSVSWWAVLILATVFGTLTVVLSVISGNYGLVIRMRLMPYIVLIPLAAVGFAVSKMGPEDRYPPLKSDLANVSGGHIK